MANITIADFKAAFNGGTRANRFMVEGTIPYAQSGSNSISKFHIQTTTIPPMSSQRIQYEYFGRKGFYPGEKQYGPWSVIILDDTGTHDLWKKFSVWHNKINDHNTNISTIPTTVTDYKAYNWTIKHLNLNGEEDPHKTFIMDGCWPRTIEPIQLNMGSPNTFVQFSVVFLFDSIRMPGITDTIP